MATSDTESMMTDVPQFSGVCLVEMIAISPSLSCICRSTVARPSALGAQAALNWQVLSHDRLSMSFYSNQPR
jgi:hypothetical protein